MRVRAVNCIMAFNSNVGCRHQRLHAAATLQPTVAASCKRLHAQPYSGGCQPYVSRIRSAWSRHALPATY
eukprot:9468297-Pyramimonas_sp.AAC.1